MLALRSITALSSLLVRCAEGARVSSGSRHGMVGNAIAVLAVAEHRIARRWHGGFLCRRYFASHETALRTVVQLALEAEEPSHRVDTVLLLLEIGQ